MNDMVTITCANCGAQAYCVWDGRCLECATHNGLKAELERVKQKWVPDMPKKVYVAMSENDVPTLAFLDKTIAEDYAQHLAISYDHSVNIVEVKTSKGL